MVNHLQYETPSLCAGHIRVVIMGVAGCGKSAVGRLIAQQLCVPLVEGDEFHPFENIRKMQHGMALTDADRIGWLRTLAIELTRYPDGVVLTCSALRAAYRDSLRRAAPELYFVHLAITEAQALLRVAQRAGHFYPASLVASQFEALEDPSSEPSVLVLGSGSMEEQTSTAVEWLRGRSSTRLGKN